MSEITIGRKIQAALKKDVQLVVEYKKHIIKISPIINSKEKKYINSRFILFILLKRKM